MAQTARNFMAATFTLFMGILIHGMCLAGTVTVSWDANSESDLSGYNIYIGEAAGTYTGTVDVGNATEFTWNRLQEGKTYYFAVTAYDFSGNESDFSAEVSATPGVSASNPPDLVDIVLKGETQLDVVFSEPLDQASAETAGNYSISNGVSVIGAVLAPDQLTVHLLTTTHQHGQSYILTVSNVADVDGNQIRAGTARSYTVPNPSGDSTPPQLNNIIVVDAGQLDVVFSEPISEQTANDKNNYQIDNGVQILQATRSVSPTVVRLTTSAHQNGVTYRLTVNNIRDLSDNAIVTNSSFSYDVNIQEVDTTPPQLLTVVVNGRTQIDLNFSEPVEKTSAETESNYTITPGVEVLGAIRDDNTSTVHLITSAHAENITYHLNVKQVLDLAATPNRIDPASDITYVFENNGRIDSGNGDPLTPKTFALFQNYPNPFNPETEIRFFLEKQRKIILKVYNPLGQVVRTLVKGQLAGGFHTIVWDGKNKDDLQVPSGVYIYSLEVKREEQRGDLLVDVSIERRVRRMTLLR